MGLPACRGNSAGGNEDKTEDQSEDGTGGQDQEGGAGGSADNGGTGGAPQNGGSGPHEERDAALPSDGPSAPKSADCDPPALKLTRVAMASSPLALAQPPGDERIYIAERAGKIRVLKGTTLAAQPFLDMSSSVARPAGDNERGLLGLAFHSDYKTNGRFFVFYTRSGTDPHSSGNNGDLVIAEGKRSSNPETAERATKVLTTVRMNDDFHNGGFFAFGKDGLLYAGTGDSARDGYAAYRSVSGDPTKQISGICQDPKEKLCKILRIDVDQPSARPEGNWAGGDVHVWAIGVRNPFKGSFDRLTGDLYFGDVGEASWEEINFARHGEAGKNWGWALSEGNRCFPWFHNFPCQPTGEPAMVAYFHAGNGVMTDPKSYMMKGQACDSGEDFKAECARAVIGGYVYRGAKIPKLQGRYIYGDHIKNTVMSLVVEQGKSTCERDLTSDLKSSGTPIQGLTAFGEDAAGELYLMDIFGNVYRIEAE